MILSIIKICIFEALLFFGICFCYSVPESPKNLKPEELPVPNSKVLADAHKMAQKIKSPSSSRRSNESCVMDCMRRMKEDIEKDEIFSQFVQKQSKPYRFDNQFDMDMLTKYCQKMNTTIKCVTPCQPSTIKLIANKALTLPKYMCIETKYVEYAPCFNKVSKMMEKTCHAEDKCAAKKAHLENLMTKHPTSLTEIKRLLEGTCSYMNCFNDCDREKLIQECGSNANNVLEGLLAKSIEVMRSMFSTMGLAIDVPAECDAVGRQGSTSGGRTRSETGLSRSVDDRDEYTQK